MSRSKSRSMESVRGFGLRLRLSLRSWLGFLRAACRTNRAFYRSHRRRVSLRPPLSNGPTTQGSQYLALSVNGCETAWPESDRSESWTREVERPSGREPDYACESPFTK